MEPCPFFLSEEMKELLEDNDKFMEFMLSSNPPQIATHSEQINPPQTTQTQLTHPLIAPITASASIPNTDTAVGAVTANASPHPRLRAAASVQGKSITIVPPFPWARDRRATVHNRKSLLEKNILKITGMLECKKCKNRSEVELDLETKFGEVWRFVETLKESPSMLDMAAVWTNVKLPTCPSCGREDCMEGVHKGTKKRAINWLFLFLNQMLCCCSLKQLKYFLRHNNIRTNMSKDRALYSVYMAICKQLEPDSAPILDHISRQLVNG